MEDKKRKSPIGVFDSGFGGLTILRELRKALPQYDYLYLGDNARAPYGSRSFDIVYRFTLEAVRYLFGQGCELVILACNTASAKALRSIQQNDLPKIDPNRRVLGVIRPTAECVGSMTTTGHIGIFATPGTVQSQSYDMEIGKLHEGLTTVGHACPMWVPLIENKESEGDGADYFVKKDIDQLLHHDDAIDTVILGCTHYPLLLPKIEKYMPKGVKIIAQGPIVAASLANYLERHSEMEQRLSLGGGCRYLTTESAEKFGDLASIFLGEAIHPEHIDL